MSESISSLGDHRNYLRPVTEIPNNYIFGPPLRPEHGRLFVGRDDTFEVIRRLWSNPLQKQSVVIYGERRMGKSSILYHLQERLASESETYLTIYADLQGLAAVDRVGMLLYNLADEISKELGLRRPARTDFRSDPFFAWRRLLERIDTKLEQRQAWLVLMLDEFEQVEAKLKDGVFPQDLLLNFRNTIQHRPRLALLFADCHTLEQMTRDYWGPFFGAAVNFKVGYLSRAAAERLITDPWDDFRLNYEPDAIERIVQVTGGQPYLLQAVCYQVVEEMNRRLKQTGPQFLPRVALTDVEGVLDHVFTTGYYYFEAVWDELARDEQLVLAALGQVAGAEGWGGRAESERLLPGRLTPEALDAAWKRLEARDMLEWDGERVRFTVELVRRWVQLRQPLDRLCSDLSTD